MKQFAILLRIFSFSTEFIVLESHQGFCYAYKELFSVILQQPGLY